MRTWEHCKNMENALSHSVKTIQAYIKSGSHTHSPMRIKCVRVRWENKPTSTEQRTSANTSDCERLSVWVECVWLCVFLSVFVSDSVCLCVRECVRVNQPTSLLTCAHPTPIKITYCKHRLKFPSYLYLTHDGKNIIRPTRSTYSLVISFFWAIYCSIKSHFQRIDIRFIFGASKYYFYNMGNCMKVLQAQSAPCTHIFSLFWHILHFNKHLHDIKTYIVFFKLKKRFHFAL